MSERIPSCISLLAISAVGNYQLEDISVVSVVKPKDKLIQIGLEILGRDTMIDTNDRPFKQRPEVLDTHCVNVTIDERLGVNDSLVLESLGGFVVTFEFISDEHIGIKADKGFEERGERIGFEVLDDLGYYVTASLLESHDNLLARSTTTTLSPGLLAADVSIIGLDNTTEFVLEDSMSHGFANLLGHTPSSLVSDTEGSLKLFSGHTFLVVTHQPDGDKPLFERSSGAVEDRSGGNRELVPASGALPDFTFFDSVGVFRSALGASNTLGPTLAAKEDFTLVLGGEPFLEFENIHA